MIHEHGSQEFGNVQSSTAQNSLLPQNPKMNFIQVKFRMGVSIREKVLEGTTGNDNIVGWLARSVIISSGLAFSATTFFHSHNFMF